MIAPLCSDGASQHTFEIRDVTRDGNELIADWVCVDCSESFFERRPIDEMAFASSEADEVD